MGEVKMVIPAYVRIGVCKKCGAQIYAPESGGMPFMSACSCAGERKVMRTLKGTKLPAQRGAARETGGKVKAA
jgi:hypothetical protein